MGNRANVAVIHGPGPAVVIYQHYCGDRMPKTVQKALQLCAPKPPRPGESQEEEKHPRWSDAGVLTWTIVRLLDTTDMEVTLPHNIWCYAYAVDTRVRDNEVGRPILLLDTKDQRASLITEKAAFESHLYAAPRLVTWSFESFIAIADVSYEAMIP